MFCLLYLLLTATLVNSQYAAPCVTPNNLSGLCMPVKSCKPIYDFLVQIEKNGGQISEQEKSQLSQYHCGTFKNVSHVCCPEKEIQLNVFGFNILKNLTCGVYMVDRVANGQETAPFQYPWMALLKYKDPKNPFKCAGTLINDQYVLTAAHCIKRGELEKVRLGEYQISTEIDCTKSKRKRQCAPPVEDIGIEEMIIHENYQSIYNDIALIRLNRKVEFKIHIKPICLPIYEYLQSKKFDNYITTGWGKTEQGNASDTLMLAYLPYVNRSECFNKLHKFNLTSPLNDGHICAGGANLVDSCQGDSGGPLTYHDTYNGRSRFIQFGIVSFGLQKCGVVNVPGVYTNVSYYIQWITDNLRESKSNINNVKPDEEISLHHCITPELQKGFCVAYKDCPLINELQQNYTSFSLIPRYYINVVKESYCSHNNESSIRLCCTFPYESSRNMLTTTEVSIISPTHGYKKLDEHLENNRQLNYTKNEFTSCTTPTFDRGYCVPYNECPFANELAKSFGSPKSIPKFYINQLIKSRCSQDNEPIKLCCKLDEDILGTTTEKSALHTINKYVNKPLFNLDNINLNKQTSTIDPLFSEYNITSTTLKSTVLEDGKSNHKSIATEDLDYEKDFISQLNPQGFKILSELNCGIIDGNRIVGGNETDLGEFPWMALLLSDSPNNEFICGGSLITNSYVLTATHCVNKITYPVTGVRLGEHDVRTNPDCKQKGRKKVCNPVTEDFGVEKIFIHPEYKFKERINDIALIKLDRNVIFKRHIKPICLPITKTSFEIQTNSFTIAGWGTTEMGMRSSVLLKANILAYSRSVCQNVFSNLVNLTSKHMCAGDLQTGRDTCRGDSGGPLFTLNSFTNTKRFVQYGIIVTGGNDCNLQQGFPGIFTNVLTFLPWISNNIVH